MDLPPACDRDDAPGFLVNQATRFFARVVDRTLRPAGVTVAGLPPLLLLAAGGEMLQRDLVRHAAIRQPAMVAALARLQRDGLVARRHHERDGRAAVFSLTERGAEVVALAGPALIEGNRRALEGFSEEERRMLTGLLRRMIANLGEADGNHRC